MNSTREITVLYTFQGEPGESFESPNCFTFKPKNKKIVFPEIIQYFPTFVQDGNYHFRFKTSDPGCGYVWSDLMAASDVIPHYSGNIVVKIIKLDEVKPSQRISRLKLKVLNNAPSFSSPIYQTAHVATTFKSKPFASESVSQSFTQSQLTQSTDRVVKSINSSKSQTSANVDKSFVQSAEAAPSPSAAPEIDFFEISDETSAQTLPHPDMFTFDSPPLLKTSAKSISGNSGVNCLGIDEAPSLASAMTREELKQMHELEIQDKVQKALDVKREIDSIQRKEAEEIEAARAKLDVTLSAWAFNHKEKRNIRTLLSTMHTVLWPGSSWKTIGLGDVIDAKQVL